MLNLACRDLRLSRLGARTQGGGIPRPTLDYDGLCFVLVDSVDMPDPGPFEQAGHLCFVAGGDGLRIAQRGDCFAVVSAPPFAVGPTLNQTTDFCFERTLP